MAADSDGSTEPQLESVSDSVTTIVTCEGDYYDPKFHDKFKIIIGKLENMLCEQPRKQCIVKNSPCRTDSVQKDTKCECKSDNVQKSNGLLIVSKLEPWNSVRVTLSIPREAAARLRQMANEGSAQLRQLGILSVQVEGDQVISLRIASRFGNENETQEIVLNTSASSSASTSSAVVAAIDQQSLSASNSSVTRFLQTSTSSNPVQQSVTTTSVPVTSSLPNGTTNEPLTSTGTRVNSEFRSPNVVCPSDTQVPLKVATTANLAQVGPQRPHEALNRPFPFASMQQAAIAIQNRTQQDFHNFAAGSRTISTPSSATPSQSVISGNATVPYTQPPPPYPSTINKIVTSTNVQHSNATNTPATPASLSGQNIAISSPLLVNLLQNEGTQNQKLDSKTCKPSKVPVSTIKNSISSNNVPVANNNSNSNSTGTFVNIASTNTKLTNEVISRVPPLPQQTNNLLVGTFDSPVQPNVVQNVQTSVVTTSSTVPSPHLSKSNILVNQNKLQPPPRPPTAPIGTVPNPRLQQTQQLRNLQQQLIQQQQSRLLPQPQKILVNPTTSNVAATLRTIQNYRNPPSAPASGPLFNSSGTVSQLNTTQPQPQPQPPPYPGSSRATIIPPQNVNRTNTVIGNVTSNNVSYPQDFQQKIQSPPQNPSNRTFNSQFPSSNVPETILPFGPSVINNSIPTVATQPVSQINSYSQLNLDTSLSNITPSLTDLSKTDLDSLLPSLTDLDGTDLNDLAKDIVDNLVPDDVDETVVPSSEPTPIQIPDELTSKGKKRVFLINPANGMLEPMPSESSSSESETEDGEIKKNKKDGIMDVFSELNEHSNSIYSDDDTSSTATSTKKGFDGTTDQSDSENKLSDSSSKLHRPKSYPKIRRESPNLISKVAQKIASKEKTPTEKIKLRLKLEKSEPVNSAYKVDVSFVNRQEPKRATNAPASISPTTKNSPSVPSTFANNTNTVSTVATTTLPSNNSTEEPRVPPLHISLRGRNSVVISNKSSKKHSQKGGIDAPLESYDDKISKKSKIRSKDKDGIKIKSRLYHKELSTNSLGKSNLHDFVENDLKNDLKLKTSKSIEIADDISTTLSSTYRREPGEIVLPNLKSFESSASKSSSKSSKKASTLSLLSSTKIADNERINSEIITNFSTTNADFIKNHKKSKPEFLSKLAFKSKFDKTKSKTEHTNEIKKVDDNKSTLKRHHSSSPTSIGSASVGTEVGTLVNGLLNSPDNKKRKLSDSILDSPIVSSVAPVVCLNSIGSTNTGTIHTSTNIQSNTNLSSSVNTTDSLSSNKMHAKSLSPLKSRKDKDRSNLVDTLSTNLTKTKNENDSAASKGTTGSYRPGTSSKSKDLNRDKTYSKIVAEKRLNQQESSKSKLLTDLKFKSNKTEMTKSMPTKLSALSLPTAGEIDMEAKFKQRLLEDTKPRPSFESDKMKLKSISNERLDHKKLTNKNTKVVLNRMDDTILHNRLLINTSEKIDKKLDDTRQIDKKIVDAVQDDKLEDNLRQLLEHNDEPDIDSDRLETEILGDINLAQILTETDLDTKQLNKVEHDESTKSSIQVVNQTQAQPNRSPPLSNSTGQGEDSGIESMDALSEKSPNNQSSQSPHCHTEIISNLVDTLTGKDSPAANDVNPKDFVSDLEPHVADNHSEIDRLLKKPANDLTELGDIEAELAKMEGYGANGECTTDILLTQINHSLCAEGSSDSNIVEQLKSELESSFNIKESDNPKKIPSEEEILAHIKSFSDKNSLNLTDYLTKQKNCFEPLIRNDDKSSDVSENVVSSHKDLNENKSDIDTKHHLADDCCTTDNQRRIDKSDNNDIVKDFKIDTSDLKVENNDFQLKNSSELKKEIVESTKKSSKVDENIYEFTTDSLEQETEKLRLVKKEEKLKEQNMFESCDKNDDKFKDNGSDHLDNDLLNHRDSPIDNDFDPLPIRRTPPLYTYSNPDKQLSRNDTDSPIVGLSDLEDGSECHSDLNSEDFNDILDIDVKTNDDSTNSTNSKMLMLRRRKQSSNVRTSSAGGLSDSICTEKQKSLLEQLLIEIPNNEYLDKSSFSSMSHSPAISEKSLTSTKTSVRTRSSSKLNSPDIILDTKHNLRTPKHSPSVTLKVTTESNSSRANSPAILHRASPKMNQTALKGIKRKRRESESSTQSTQSTEDSTAAPATRNNKKLRKCPESMENSLTKTIVTTTNPLKQKTGSATTTTATTTTRQTKNPNRKLNTNEESSDSDEPLIEIAGKVRNLNVINVNKNTSVATRNKVLATGTSTTTTNKILTINTTTTTTTKLQQSDDQKASPSVVVGTRRSVRHNNTAVTCTSATLTTSTSSTMNTTNNIQTGLKTRSTKLGTITANATVTTTTPSNTLIATNSPLLSSSTIDAVTTNTESNNTSSMASRRKTRSAVTESLHEKRTRRNSKDGK